MRRNVARKAGKLLVTREPRRTHPTLDGGAFAIALSGVKEASVAHAKRAISERRAGAGSTFLPVRRGLGRRAAGPCAFLRDVAAHSGEAPLRVSLFIVPGRALELTAERTGEIQRQMPEDAHRKAFSDSKS